MNLTEARALVLADTRNDDWRDETPLTEAAEIERALDGIRGGIDAIDGDDETAVAYRYLIRHASLTSLRVPELRRLAAQFGIPRRSRMAKAELTHVLTQQPALDIALNLG